MTALDKLQAEYDQYVQIRAEIIRRFDRAADGTQEKIEADAQLSRVGKRIRILEDRMADVLNSA